MGEEFLHHQFWWHHIKKKSINVAGKKYVDYGV